MTARDAFRFINDLDDATVEVIAQRLEFRGRGSGLYPVAGGIS